MTKYTTIAGDMWDGIAYKTLGDEAYTDRLMKLNPQYRLRPAAVEARDCRMNARRTVVRLTFAGVDISADINKHLLSLTYTDNEEDKTDDLQLSLDDREGVWLGCVRRPAYLCSGDSPNC